jgi:SSS family solute:Na+ symporter
VLDAQRSLLIGGYLLIPQMLLFLFIGVILATYYQQHGLTPPDNLNELLPRYVVNAFPLRYGRAGDCRGICRCDVKPGLGAQLTFRGNRTGIFTAVISNPMPAMPHYLKASRMATVFWGLYATLFAFFLRATLAP